MLGVTGLANTRSQNTTDVKMQIYSNCDIFVVFPKPQADQFVFFVVHLFQYTCFAVSLTERLVPHFTVGGRRIFIQPSAKTKMLKQNI